MKTQYYITAGMVREHGACDYGQEQFEAVFGYGKVMLTRENVQKALDHGLPVRWPALQLRDAFRNGPLTRVANSLYYKLLDVDAYGPADVDAVYKLLREVARLFNEHRQELRP